MFYISIFSCVILISSMSYALSFSRALKILFLGFGVFLLFLASSLQYGVGTDYFNYQSIYNGVVSHDLFFRKGELLFYYLYEFLIGFDLGDQSVFVFTSFFQSLTLFLIFKMLFEKGYGVHILLLFYLFATGMFHNQMNGIRTFTAVYFFIASFLFISDRKFFLGAVFYLFAVLSHSTALFLFPLMILPSVFWRFISANRIIIFFLANLFWLFGLGNTLVIYLVQNLAPFYSHYLHLTDSPANILNILSKAYWLPLYLWFLIMYRGVNFSDFSGRLVGIWVLSSGLYFSLFYTTIFFRAHHYFSFFMLIPLYFVFIKSNLSHRIVISVYSLFPFILKVLIFPKGEYLYDSVLFR